MWRKKEKKKPQTEDLAVPSASLLTPVNLKTVFLSWVWEVGGERVREAIFSYG